MDGAIKSAEMNRLRHHTSLIVAQHGDLNAGLFKLGATADAIAPTLLNRLP